MTTIKEAERKQPQKFFVKSLKVLGWIAASLILLLVALILLIRLPAVQTKITQKAISFLQNKIGTPVSLESITISFPKKIILKSLYLEDQSGDTLLYAGSLGVDTDLWGLMHHTIELNTVELENITSKIERSAKYSAFNFDYIVKAFASDSTTPQDTTATSWVFTIEDVSIKKTRLRYQDFISKNDATLSIGSLEVNMNEFDLDKSVFHAGTIALSDSKISFAQSAEATTALTELDTTQAHTTPFAYDISIDEINLKNVSALYSQTALGQFIRADVGEIHIEADDIDLGKQVIHLDRFEMNNTLLSYQQTKQPKTELLANSKSQIEPKPATLNFPWSLALQELKLTNNSIQYYNFNEPLKKVAFDYNHLWVFGLEATAKDVLIEGATADIDLNHFSFQEKGGFAIQSLSAKAKVSDQQIKLENLRLNAGSTTIAMSGEATFQSLAELAENYGGAQVTVNVNPSVISMKDILFFIPTLTDSLPISIPSSTQVRMEAAVKGKLNNLTISKLLLQTLDSTTLDAKGIVKGLPNINQALMNITLDKFYTTRADMKAILPDSLLPASIELPTWVNVQGKFNGTIATPNINTIITSSSGTVEANGVLNLNNVATYDATVKVKELNLGQILKQEETIGMLNLEAAIKGSGITMEDLDAVVNLTVSKFQYNKYDYTDFKLDGFLKKYFFSGKASLADKNLDFALTGDLDYQKDTPNYKLTFELKNIDFKALNLSALPLKARGTLDVDLATSDFKVINGHVDIRKFAIYNGTHLYMVDSLLMASIDQQGESEISIRSDIVSGDFKGTINLYSLPDVVRQHVNQYFSLHDTTLHKSLAPQNFKFNLIIKNTDLLTEVIFPDLEPFVPGEISGEFNSAEERLDVRVGISKIKYAATSVDSLVLKLTSDKNAMNYRFALKNLLVDTLRIDELSLTGKIAHDSIYTSFNILDSLGKEKYQLGGVVRSLDDNFLFHFIPGKVMLNYNAWQVPVDNSLQFGYKGLIANHFDITKGKEKIALLTTTSSDSIISVAFQELQLENITSMVRGVVPASGRLNGDLKFTTSKSGEFSSKLIVNDLAILQKKWGDLTFTLAHAANKYNIDMLVKGTDNNITAKGFYTEKETLADIDIAVDFSPLNLELVEPLSFRQLKNVKGAMRGQLSVTGNPTSPAIRGELVFKDANFTPTALNSAFTLKNESITFREAGIAFSSFTLLDDQGNAAVVRGAINTKAYKDFDLDLSLTSKDFQILNTEADNKKLYYGKVKLNTTAKITGPLNHPSVVVKVGLSDDTNVTYVIPQNEKNVLEQKGIVVFIDKDAKNDPFLASINPSDTIQSSFVGLTLTANIELSGKETLNVVMDPITGEKLTVQGNSTLTLNMDESGNMSLSGRYEITKGTYNLSFHKIVKREFVIEKGGSISWAGDPLNATLDLRASNTVETSPLDLISNQISSDNPTELNSYRQRLPFLVYLNIKGQLLAPQISFQLDMPQSSQNAFGGAIYAKILDINTRESDLNKQVFALLILRRFISDNPLESQAGSDLSNSTRTSASRLLTEQLNRLSQNIKGVQLSIDLKSYEDYSGGEAQGRTSAQLGVSKSLFNERLVVKLAGNVDIEGQNTNQGSVSDYIGDLALEYKLTPDGRFRITGFRNSNYDMINGEITQTGTGLIYIKDYNTLRELFKANEVEK